MTGNSGSASIRLTTANTDRVSAARDNWMAIGGYHSKIAVFQFEVNLLACSGIEVNALESAERNIWRARDWRKFQVELHHFVARNFSGIRHSNIGVNRISGIDRGVRQCEIAVTELRITETIAKRIKRFAAEIAVGAVRHRIIFEIRQ